MRRILVTGANKGIGLAIATAIVSEHDDTVVLLGVRDPRRGGMAVEALRAGHPSLAERVQWIELDVSSGDSVAAAARAVAERWGTRPAPLYGLVNNAGVGGQDLDRTIEVNLLGVRRVCEAFVPLLDPEQGRIVNITSASGPNFVSQCSSKRQRFFVDPEIEWAQLQGLVDECFALKGDRQAFWAKGLGDGDAYGLSKACANSYTMLLAKRYPQLRINACTPGYIETDMTRPHAVAQGKAPAELGMKAPAEGARAALFLLFGDLVGNGRYYGSDGQRSPLDRYRAPGDPPYVGDTL